MKKKGCAVLGCLGTVLLIAAVAGVIGIGTMFRLSEAPPSPEPTPEPPPGPGPGPAPTGAPWGTRRATPTPAPAVDPDRFLSHPGEWRQFARDDDGPRYRLRYGFVDYSGRRHDVSCGISKAAVDKARRVFGWDQREIASTLNAELQEAVDAEIARRGLTGFVRVSISEYGSWRREVVHTPEDEAGRAQIDRFDAWLREEFMPLFTRIEARTFRRHGLLVRDRNVQIDYNRLAVESTGDVQSCYDALLISAGSATGTVAASDRYFMGVLLAFFQELKYERPPDKEGARDIFGLWVPTQVLSDGKGDCDSKALAFASIWRQRSARVIVILVPEHALIGVEGKPGPQESYVRVGNRYYVLCEVAGPGKLPPGHKSISGTFEYVEIEST